MLARIDAFLSAHGMGAVAKRLAHAYIRSMASELDTFARVRPWLLSQINGSRPDRSAGVSAWQRGCPNLIPGLRAHNFWDPHDLPELRELEGKFDAIRAELLALRGQNVFKPYRAPLSKSATTAADGVGSTSHDSGDWNVLYLFLHNLDFTENRARCPVTCEAIQAVSGNYSHAMFSAMAPRTHITKHNGPTNKKLRCHLPLVVPQDRCRLRVGSETRIVQEGRCLVFDDSFEHEAWNDDPEDTRIVLIFDVWHPDLHPKEVKFLSFLQNAALRAEKVAIDRRHADQRGEPAYDNFFTVIKNAQQLHKDDGAVFGGLKAP